MTIVTTKLNDSELMLLDALCEYYGNLSRAALIRFLISKNKGVLNDR